MKKIPVSVFIALLLMLLVAIPVLAAIVSYTTLEDELPEVATVPVYGLNLQPSNNTFYAQDRHWVLYVDEDSDVVYTSAESGGAWAEHDIVADTSLYGWEVACWYDYDTNYLHYARHELGDPDDYVRYRMGTPNDDGTITWAAAEQAVAITPGDLNNFRTTICLDKNGYPWIAWIDTNGVGAYGIVYVESSATNDGTWVEDVAEEFDLAEHHAWCVSIVPVSEGADTDVIELEYTIEDQTEGEHDGEVAIWNQVYNNTGAGNWTNGDEAVVGYGSFYDTRPDAFDVYNMNDDVHVVYTAVNGAVGYIIRGTGESWAENEAVTIKYTESIWWIPTISGYKARGVGEDLMVIVHNDDALYYATHTYGQAADSWNTWHLIWVTPDLGNDTINRHVASYKYNSPIGFAWEYVDDSADPDVDVVNYWWVDNEKHALGYYGTGYWILSFIALALGIMAAIFVIVAIVAWKSTEHKMLAMVAGLAGVIFAGIAVVLASIV